MKTGPRIAQLLHRAAAIVLDENVRFGQEALEHRTVRL
jgi:hypothetical protein